MHRFIGRFKNGLAGIKVMSETFLFIRFIQDAEHTKDANAKVLVWQKSFQKTLQICY
nr:MAG TPA: hypothetical protein [Caudoviricetes sp.]DAT90215.1 MAG TPA: hypothetical protein [Caudoviricetes sp.]